ncbi:MAG: helix-turn-helix domain-containing protein [Geopsychrobacter sp.]|nr:helix-turn-helix domain-containing protein [Geopsychrobacter sp.]
MSEPIKKQDDVQFIEENGAPVFAVIPIKKYQDLVNHYVPKESDITIPHAVVKANVKGDSMVKAWREYLGLTQEELAARAGMTQPAIAKLEKSDANLRRKTLEKLAVAMDLVLEQLEE